MKITIVHIPYEFKGGEDLHVEKLYKIYEKMGWSVQWVSGRDKKTGSQNYSLLDIWSSISSVPLHPSKWKLAIQSKEVVEADILHLHNVHPILGYEFLEWCAVSKKRIWWTIHNHRFFCTNGLALRDGHNCQLCLPTSNKWRAVAYNCNGDIRKSAYYSASLTKISKHSLWHRLNATYVALSPYIENKLIEFGVPKHKIEFIPNPVAVDALNHSVRPVKDIDVLYCGRLSQEKGIALLLKMAPRMPHCKIAVAGDGPLRGELEQAMIENKHLSYLGPVPPTEVGNLLRRSKVAIQPSICNEILPTFLLEALVTGTKAVASDSESLQWLRNDPFLIRTATTGNVDAFAQAIESELLAPEKPEEITRNVQEFFSSERFEDKMRLLAKK